MYLSRKFFSRNANKSLSPLLLNQYRMNGLSGKARDTSTIKDARLKFTSHVASHYTTSRDESYLVYQYSYRHGTFVDVLLNLRTLRNRYAAGAANIPFVVPVGLHRSMFSKEMSNLGRPLGKRNAIRKRRMNILYSQKTSLDRLFHHIV